MHKISIQQQEKNITCFSEGIYPEPKITWSTIPPSDVTPITQNVQLTKDNLYNISSSLSLLDSDDVDYICTIKTERSSRRAALFKQGKTAHSETCDTLMIYDFHVRSLIVSASITDSYTEATIPCSGSSSHHSGLVWRYNHSQIILTQSSAESSYSATEQWRQHVKDVSGSGSLTLHKLTSSQEGVYTCEISDDKETRISNTFVRLNQGKVFALELYMACKTKIFTK